MTDTERRTEERSDCELAATIDMDGEPIACVVRDISVDGARIAVDPEIALPDEFDLVVPAVPGADQRFRVVTRWRRDGFLGGEFLQG